MYKKLILATAIGSTFASFATAAEPASPHTFTGNVGLVSDYLFRGISQSHGKPAIQGGFDYAHASGFYAGAWGSSISWVSDAQNVSVPVEIDVYGGYKNSFAGDWTYDVGLITYNYPGSKSVPANASAKADTTEVYAALGWKWLSAKYSYATSSHFIGWYGGNPATGNTRGSDYLELNASYDMGNGWGLSGHIGHQKVKNYVATPGVLESANYTDWKVGVSKDVGFGVVSLAYSDTDAKGTCPGGSTAGTSSYCWGVYSTGGTTGYRDASQSQVVLSFTKSF